MLKMDLKSSEVPAQRLAREQKRNHGRRGTRASHRHSTLVTLFTRHQVSADGARSSSAQSAPGRAQHAGRAQQVLPSVCAVACSSLRSTCGHEGQGRRTAGVVTGGATRSGPGATAGRAGLTPGGGRAPLAETTHSWRLRRPGQTASELNRRAFSALSRPFGLAPQRLGPVGGGVGCCSSTTRCAAPSRCASAARAAPSPARQALILLLLLVLLLLPRPRLLHPRTARPRARRLCLDRQYARAAVAGSRRKPALCSLPRLR